MTNHKHYPDLGSDTSSVSNFCARSSDVNSRGNQWQHCNIGRFLRSRVAPPSLFILELIMSPVSSFSNSQLTYALACISHFFFSKSAKRKCKLTLNHFVSLTFHKQQSLIVCQRLPHVLRHERTGQSYSDFQNRQT